MNRAAAAALTLALVALAGCQKSSGTPAQEPGQNPAAGPSTTKVTAFSVHQENLNVDKISMKEGAIHPDGNRDLVFTATVEGPADALYLVTTDEKGSPVHGFRADTIGGSEELPQELAAAGQVDVGRLTVWMAVVENNQFVNEDNGRLGKLAPGPHALKMYVPNTGTLRPGSHLRLYARVPGGAIVGGPVVPY